MGGRPDTLSLTGKSALLEDHETRVQFLRSQIIVSFADTIALVHAYADHVFRIRNQLYVPTLLLCMLAMQERATTKLSNTRICFALAHGFFAETSPIMPTPSFFDDITKLIDNIVLGHTGDL